MAKFKNILIKSIENSDINEAIKSLSTVQQNLLKNYSNPVFNKKDKNKLLNKYSALENIGKSIYRYNHLNTEVEKENLSAAILKSGISNTKYVWHSENGEHTCEKCKNLDGTVYDFEDEVPQRPHPNCKCYVEIVEDNEPCDCNEIYNEIVQILEETEKMINEANPIIVHAENTLKEIEDLVAVLELKLDLLKDEVGKHLQECEYYVDEFFRQNYTAYEQLIMLCRDIKSFMEPAKTLAESFGTLAAHFFALIAENDGSMDKYYHSKANCENAQKGMLYEIYSEVLCNLKEGWDIFSKTIIELFNSTQSAENQKTIILDKVKDSEEDQVINKLGRERGRQYPLCDCSNLIWDQRPPHKQERRQSELQ